MWFNFFIARFRWVIYFIYFFFVSRAFAQITEAATKIYLSVINIGEYLKNIFVEVVGAWRGLKIYRKWTPSKVFTRILRKLSGVILKFTPTYIAAFGRYLGNSILHIPTVASLKLYDIPLERALLFFCSTTKLALLLSLLLLWNCNTKVL